MSKVYTGDTGTVIVLDCGQDISAATGRTIEVRKPSGATASWSAVAEGTTGIKFTTMADSLDQSGDWRLQARVVTLSGAWRGEAVTLTVHPNFA